MDPKERKAKERRLLELRYEKALRENNEINKKMEESKPSMAESGMRGAAQGVSLGFADEATAGVGAMYDYLEGKFGGRGEISYGDAYRTRRDAIREADDKAAAANPNTYLAGEVGGAVGTAFVPGMGALNASKGAKAAEAVGKAAAGGGASGLGLSEADVTKGQLPEAFDDARQGALLGAGFGAGSKALGKFMTPSQMKQFAERRAVKAATGQNKKALEDLAKTGRLQKTGRSLLEKDEAGKPVVQFGNKVEDVAPKAKAKQEFYGDKIGTIGKQIDETVPDAVSGERVSKRILDYASEIPETPKNKSQIKRLLDEAQFYQNRGNIKFDEAQKLKGSYTFKPTDSTTQVLGQDATNAVRRFVSEEMENSVKELPEIMKKQAQAEQAMGRSMARGVSEGTQEATSGGGRLATGSAEAAAGEAGESGIPQYANLEQAQDLAEDYTQAKSQYGAFRTTADHAEERAIGNLSNRWISPSDYWGGGFLGGGSLAAGSDPAGVVALATAGTAANKLFRERGSSMAAVSADKIGKVLEKTPDALGPFAPLLQKASQRGSHSLGATHYMLWQKQPEYRELFKGDGDRREAIDSDND